MGYKVLNFMFAAIFVIGCSPSDPVYSDIEITDRVPSRALANSPIQQEATAILVEGMRELNASAGGVVILDVNSGQVLSLVSMVNQTRTDLNGPQFNRAVNRVHELGRVMAIFPIAQAIEEGLIVSDSMVETPPFLSMSGFQIRDFRPSRSEMTPEEIFIYSSNVGTAQIAQQIGPTRQRAFLEGLGFLDSNSIEDRYSTDVEPQLPRIWGGLTNAVTAYGHGLTVSPLQVAAGYASLVNGGTRVVPTFTQQSDQGRRVISEETSAYVRTLLREFVVSGTASLADIPGYSVGGASGTADLRLPDGSFWEGHHVATFVAVFPIEDPQYVVVTLLEDAVFLSEGSPRRTAGWTVVPLSGEIIARIGPLLSEDP